MIGDAGARLEYVDPCLTILTLLMLIDIIIILKYIDDFQNSYEYLGRCRRWAPGAGAARRRACLARQQWIPCLTRLDPALAAILLVVAFHDGLHSWLETALACIDHHQDTEVRRVDVGVREVASTREVLLDIGLMW